MIQFVVGSKNDQKYLREAEKIFETFDLSYKIQVYSCHRNLKELMAFLDTVRSGKNKTDAIVAVANSVANLPAIIAGYLKDMPILVIGIGLSGTRMNGVDSLLSIATIPRKVPLLNTGIDEVGLYNAALACVNVLAMKDRSLEKKVAEFYRKLAK